MHEVLTVVGNIQKKGDSRQFGVRCLITMTSLWRRRYQSFLKLFEQNLLKSDPFKLRCRARCHLCFYRCSLLRTKYLKMRNSSLTFSIFRRSYVIVNSSRIDSVHCHRIYNMEKRVIEIQQGKHNVYLHYCFIYHWLYLYHNH